MTPKELGQYGENIAVQHLQAQNYTVIDRNYRFQKVEIDIIALKDGRLIACEVKTRASAKIVAPYRAVNHKKQQHIIHAINHYVQSKQMDIDVQFDVLSIVHNNRHTEIDHIPNAFVPSVCAA